MLMVSWLADATKWRAVQIQPSVTGNAVQDLDLLMAKLWEENNVKPVRAASDEELLRRVYLDLAGRTPSVNEVRDYLKNTSPDKYESLVNRLLNSPDHASHLAAKFRSFLLPEGVDLTNFGGVEAFEKWLAARFQKNETVRQNRTESPVGGRPSCSIRSAVVLLSDKA